MVSPILRTLEFETRIPGRVKGQTLTTTASGYGLHSWSRSCIS